MTIFRSFPFPMWAGLFVMLATSLGHLWLEYDRGNRVAPQLKAGPDLIAHTFNVISTSQALRRSVQDAERGQRGYLLTGDRLYLEPYHRGIREAPKHLAHLRQMTTDNPERQRLWPLLEQRIDDKFNELARALEVHESRGLRAARDIIRSNAGRDAMDEISAMVETVIASERVLAGQRLARAAQFERQGQRAAMIGALLQFIGLLIGIALVTYALRAITASDRAQRDAERRFHVFTSGVADYAIYMLDTQGNVVEWNLGAERIKGYAAKEIIGQHFSRFYTEEDRQAGVPQRALERALREGKFEDEGWRVRKNGQRFIASVYLSPLRDEAGKHVGFAKITRDVNDRVRQQQQLAQYQKMDALGQLTSGIAHDFNNLLHVIKNAVEILEHRLRDLPPDTAKYLGMLKRNADRAASLTHRLLTFSRRAMLDPKPINPNVLLTEVAVLLRQALGENIEIETVSAAGAWWISADANQLETAILNLALNARDAMAGQGKLTIEIANAYLDDRYAAAHSEVKPGQYVMVAVSDTGAGMTPDVIQKAFDPFFTTKEVGQGTGLGLSQVYGFAKQSGGHAKIYSEPGQGTTVKLYLPRLTGPHDVNDASNENAKPPRTGQGTILVVEDDDDVREFTGTVLREIGYRVFSARDAAAALIVLEAEPAIDLLFTDIGLPGGVNGRALADEALRRSPRLKVLFATGYTRNAVIHHGRVDPGVELIVKPFTQAALAEKVKQVMSAK